MESPKTPNQEATVGNECTELGAQPRRREGFLGAVLVLVTFGLIIEAGLWRPDTRFTIKENIQIAEADAWWQGRLDLPERKWDTALFEGRVYSHFPPMFTFVSAALVPFFGGVPHAFIVLGLVLPILLLSYVLFLRRTQSVVWGALLAIGLTCGTSLLPVLDKTLRGASPYFVNQSLATIGLLLVLNESFSRRRMWLAGIGLVIAALSRQMTVAYALPLLWLASSGETKQDRTRRSVVLVVVLAVVVLVPCTLNALKFSRPLDTGYMHVYNDRPEDSFSRDARAHGLFSAHFVPRNLYYANLGFPKVYRLDDGIHLRPNHMGTGIWWTTPLLLWLLLDFGRILRSSQERIWLVAAALVFAGLMFYQCTGYDQRGFNRFSLDYVPVLLTLVAPRCVSGRRRWVTLIAIVWSVVYFRLLI